MAEPGLCTSFLSLFTSLCFAFSSQNCVPAIAFTVVFTRSDSMAVITSAIIRLMSKSLLDVCFAPFWSYVERHSSSFSICLCTAMSSFPMFVSTRLCNRLFLSFWFSSCQPSVVGNLAAMPIPTNVTHAWRTRVKKQFTGWIWLRKRFMVQWAAGSVYTQYKINPVFKDQ